MAEHCPNCLGTDIQVQMWVNPNTNRIFDDAGGYGWCNDCENTEGDGEFKYVRFTDDIVQSAIKHHKDSPWVASIFDRVGWEKVLDSILRLSEADRP